MKKLTSSKIMVLVICMIVISIMLIYVVINRDKLFIHKIKIRYPDNCVETFINGKLASPNCTEGRRMLEEYEENKKWYLKSNLTNLTFQE